MLNALSGDELFFAAAVVTVAYFVRGVAGFGSGLIAIPLLTLLLPLPAVVPLIVFLDYTASASQGLRWRKDVRWRELLPLLPFSMVGVLAALVVLRTASAEALSHGLGYFVLFFGAYQLSDLKMSFRYSRGWGVLAGGSGGLIGTLFGTGGPFYVIYFRLRCLNKSEFRATFAATFLIDGSWRLVGYLASGLVTRDFLHTVLMALPVMGVALYVGSHVHTRVSQQAFHYAISLLLVGSGIALVAK